MAPSMVKKAGKEKKEKKALAGKSKAVKKPKGSSREEVERSLKIADMLLEQQEIVHSEDERLSDDDYIRSLKVDPIAMDKGDDGFEVDKGEEGVVKVRAGDGDEGNVEVVDTREKRPKVANSLRSLRLAIAEKVKKAQEDRKAKVLARGGFESGDEDD